MNFMQFFEKSNLADLVNWRDLDFSSYESMNMGQIGACKIHNLWVQFSSRRYAMPGRREKAGRILFSIGFSVLMFLLLAFLVGVTVATFLEGQLLAGLALLALIISGIMAFVGLILAEGFIL